MARWAILAMSEDFMKGKSSIDRLPDDYRNSNILISITDKNNFDLAIENSKESEIKSENTNSITR